MIELIVVLNNKNRGVRRYPVEFEGACTERDVDDSR